MTANPPPPRPDSAPERKKGLHPLLIVVIVVVVGGFLVQNFGSSTGSGGSRSGTHYVAYSVTGGQGASVTYQTSSQDSAQDTDARTPWTDIETMEAGDFYYVSAQNHGGGTIACSVTVDGDPVDSNSSSGQYAICTASGSV